VIISNALSGRVNLLTPKCPFTIVEMELPLAEVLSGNAPSGRTSEAAPRTAKAGGWVGG